MELELSQIRPKKDSLRDVDLKDTQVQEMVESVKVHGVTQPILVTPREDENGAYYELVDGLHRFTAARQVGLKTIPVVVRDNVSDEEATMLQIINNLHRIETKPAQYARALRKMIQEHPTLTEKELCRQLNVSESWMRDRLSLTKLGEVASKLVDNGSIKLANAYHLATLPEEEQEDWISQAQTTPTNEFSAAVRKRVGEIRKAKLAGRSAEERTFEPNPTGRKTSELKEAYDDPKDVIEMVKSQGLKTAEQIIQATIGWALHLDPVSVEAQRAKWEAAEAKRKESAEARKAENAQKKAERLQKQADEAKAEAEAAVAANQG